MAFAVTCKSCQARFLLNDDLLRRKVAGRVVTVRCRQCHATIEVDASDVDPQALQQSGKPAPPGPPPAPTPLKPMNLKPTPAPPRPVKSQTLMGIGGPPKPVGATELVALSPGFLDVGKASPVGARGFPEPPPPPGAVEELNSGDWVITEPPPLAKTDADPESVDDFIEELPPSVPPASEDDLPSSTGTPSLKALAHHDLHPPKPRSDDFLANMSAALNGGVTTTSASEAPTIDVSSLSAANDAPSIDLSSFDVPLTGKSTLPLFGLADAGLEAPHPPRPAAPKPAPSPPEGSLSPASLDRLERDAERPDSVRSRRNVVAPATKSEPPTAGTPRRSGLAAPVLLALAVAAGFLIWKRGAATKATVDAVPEPAPAAVAEAKPTLPAPVIAAAPAAVAESSAVPDDVTFETTPIKTNVAPTTALDKTAAATAVASKPVSALAAPAEPKPEPALVKEEPKPAAPTPAEPSEPAGPFDRAAAASALTSSAAQASACRKDGDPSGVASVVITFAPSGRVTSANLSGPPFAGTATGGCIAGALRKARVPPFEGERVTVSKTIVIQ